MYKHFNFNMNAPFSKLNVLGSISFLIYLSFHRTNSHIAITNCKLHWKQKTLNTLCELEHLNFGAKRIKKNPFKNYEKKIEKTWCEIEKKSVIKTERQIYKKSSCAFFLQPPIQAMKKRRYSWSCYAILNKQANNKKVHLLYLPHTKTRSWKRKHTQREIYC